MRRRSGLEFVLAAGLLAAGLTLGFRRDEVEVDRIVRALDLHPGEVLADVGAGDGRFTFALARVLGERGRVYATEVDVRDLEALRARARDEAGAGNVTVVEGTQEGTGLPDDCCDKILLRRVYHHFQDPQAMRAGLARALRSDGLLLVIDFGPRRWGRPQGVPASRTGHGIASEIVVSEMESGGFELVEQMDWRGSDYALLFREKRESRDQ